LIEEPTVAGLPSVVLGVAVDGLASVGLITEGFVVCVFGKPDAGATFGCSVLGELDGVVFALLFSIMKRLFKFTAKFCC
jgi:hypothetical protein